MAFTVQDDLGGVAGANAYVDLASFKTYHDDRGGDYSASSDAQLQQAIIKATDYLDTRFCFVGFRRNRDQTTEWPRGSAIDLDGRVVSGVPEPLKNACIEYAFRALTSTLMPDPSRDASGVLIKRKKEKTGPIEEETEYSDGRGFALPEYPAADQMLFKAGLVCSGLMLERA